MICQCNAHHTVHTNVQELMCDQKSSPELNESVLKVMFRKMIVL